MSLISSDSHLGKRPQPRSWTKTKRKRKGYDLIKGHEYITVASAGATFVHEGPGNVDMLSWVTMTDDGPEIANLALKGIFDRKGLDPEMFGAYDRAPGSGGLH